MGNSGSPLDVSPDDVRRVFSRRDEPSTPLTATDVAEELNRPEHAVKRTLERLADRGAIRTRQVDERTRVWWRPAHRPEIVEFGEFVRAVEDYAIFRLDPDGTVVSWNEGATRIKGYETEEILGEHVSTFYTAEEIEAGVPEANLETAASEGRVEDEGWRVRKDGSRFWASVVITAVHDADGELQGFTKVTRDMTEQREYERRLRQERDLTEQILDTAPVGIGVVEPGGTLRRANRRMLDHHGIDEANRSAYNLSSLELYDRAGDPIPMDDWPIRRVAETGELVSDFQAQVEPVDGPRRWWSISAAPLDDGTTDELFVAAVDDITEQKERERNLRRERNQTEKLLRTVPIPIAVQNGDGKTLLANRHAQEALGLTEREILDEPDDADEWTIYDDEGESLDPDQTPAARVLATGEPLFDEHVTIVPPTGDRMEFTINAAPVFDSEGEIDRVIVAGEDITALKDRERRLKRRKSELETELSEILGRVSDAFYALDDEWRFTHINDRALEIFGRPVDDLLGQSVWEVFSQTGTDDYREKFEAVMDTQEPTSFEVYEEAMDTWLEFNVYPSESGISIYFRDVTDRKRHEHALRERERRLQRYKAYTDDVLDAIDDIFYILDENGQLQRWNESLRNVTGYADAEVDSMHALDFFGESEHERIANAIAAGFETGDTRVEADVRTKDGESIPYEFVASTLEDPEGNPVLAGIGRDTTDRREYERKLEASNERLEQFAYAASHDLQEPLRMVSSYVQLIDRRYSDVLDEDGREFVEFAVDGADRMRDMIDALLEYSRVETQGDPFEPVELDHVLADAREDLQIAIEESDATITAESLPHVEGDPAQLRQVFQNLLDNAIEYSGDDPPQIHVDARRVGSEWQVSVSDDGIGIDPDDAERIFDVFQRLHGREEHVGTGIGLALCRRIVERHGGEIWVESEPGEGSTFRFTLPAVDG